MIIDRINPSFLGDHPLDVAIVIDVLRATSTATVLLGRGVEELFVIATPPELRQLAPLDQGLKYLLFTELTNFETTLDRVDNSPVVAKDVRLDGHVPVLMSTNGTRAARAAVKVARKVIFGSFLNVFSIAEHLRRTSPERVSLLPAGDYAKGTAHHEDEQCALIIESLVRGTPLDSMTILDQCDGAARLRRDLAPSGSGFTGDLKLALTPDLYRVVPVVRFGTSAGEGPLVASRLEEVS